MEDQNKTVLLEIEERLKKEMGKLRGELSTARDFNQRLGLNGRINGMTEALKIIIEYTAHE
jgi:hypothetical protein